MMNNEIYLKTTIQQVEFKNVYEFGKASNRFKLYFTTAEDLKKQIESLRALGFGHSVEDE